jgi:hypothetical protein
MRHSRGVADTLTAATSFWPTPMGGTPAQNGNSAAGNSDFSRKAEELAAGLWMTPDVPNGGRALKPGTSATGKRPDGSKAQVGLNNQVMMWTTPQAHDVTPRGSGQKPTAKAGNACLATDAQQWPSPQARDHRSGDSPDHLINGTGRLHLDQLPNAVAFLYTRPDPETEAHGRLSWHRIQIARHLLRAAMSLPPRSISRPHCRPRRRQPSNPHYAAWREARAWQRWQARRLHWWTKRRLSPAFVTWLMGWPSGHALCACSGTEFTLWRQQMRGALSAMPTASGPWIWKPPAEVVHKATQLDLFA